MTGQCPFGVRLEPVWGPFDVAQSHTGARIRTIPHHTPGYWGRVGPLVIRRHLVTWGLATVGTATLLTLWLERQRNHRRASCYNHLNRGASSANLHWRLHGRHDNLNQSGHFF